MKKRGGGGNGASLRSAMSDSAQSDYWGRTLKRNGQVYTAIGRLATIGSFAKRATANKFTRASCFFVEQRKVATVQWFGKKSGAYHTSFNHQRSTKRPKSNAKKIHVDQMACRLARNRKHSLRHDYFRAKYRYSDGFSSAVFNHFPLEDFSQTNGNRLVGAPRAHFRQNSKSTNCPNFSLINFRLGHTGGVASRNLTHFSVTSTWVFFLL